MAGARAELDVMLTTEEFDGDAAPTTDARQFSIGRYRCCQSREAAAAVDMIALSGLCT